MTYQSYYRKNMKIDMWYLAIIKDSGELSGKSIFKLLNIIQQIEIFEYVILNDINGAGIAELSENENKLLLLANIIKSVEKVVQFDWGDFFLFKNPPEVWNNEDKSYDKLIATTDTTIRAIDDTYIYVYTQSEKILNILKKKYAVESVFLDFIENLEFPY